MEEEKTFFVSKSPIAEVVATSKWTSILEQWMQKHNMRQNLFKLACQVLSIFFAQKQNLCFLADNPIAPPLESRL